jgi:hypothetical protein
MSPVGAPAAPDEPLVLSDLQTPSSQVELEGSGQSSFVTHWTHWDVSGSQAGVSPVQASVLSSEQATQMPDASQTGVFGSLPAHSASDAQPTQV